MFIYALIKYLKLARLQTSLLILLMLSLVLSPAYAKNFFQEIQSNLKKAFTPSKFVCDKYERQEYEIPVLKPGLKLPFTEIFPKKRVCVEWEWAGKGAVKRKCVKHEYINTSKSQQKTLYRMVKRHRTVCVQGHTTR